MAKKIKDEVLDWYVSKCFHPAKLLNQSRQQRAMKRTYPEDHVLWAMQQLYALIHSHGETIKDINIARKVWSLAGQCSDDDIEQFRSGQRKWEEALETISEQKRRIAYYIDLNTYITKWLFAGWGVAVAAIIAACIAYGSR